MFRRWPYFGEGETEKEFLQLMSEPSNPSESDSGEDLSRPSDSLEGHGILRDGAKKMIQNSWLQFIETEKWSPAVEGALRAVLDVVLELIDEAPRFGKTDSSVLLSAIPSRLTPAAIFYGILLYGVRSASQKPSGFQHDGQLARALAKVFPLSEDQLYSAISRSMRTEVREHPNSPQKLSSIVSEDAQSAINEAKRLADELSKGVVGTRHLITALTVPLTIDSAPLVSIDEENLDPGKLLNVLRDFFQENGAVQYQDKGGGKHWELIWPRLASYIKGQKSSIKIIDQGEPEAFEELSENYGVSDEVKMFLAYIADVVGEENIPGALSGSALFLFLKAWAIDTDRPLRSFFDTVTDGSAEKALTDAFEALIGDANDILPFVSLQVSYIFRRAEGLANEISRGKVEIHHLIAGMLLDGEQIEPPTPGQWLENLTVVTLRELVKEFLSYLGGNTPESLPAFRRLFLSNFSSSFGTFSQSSREATGDELGIGINELSNSVQTLFETTPANTDLVFALYGPWGRGKTTLMNMVRTKLAGSSKSDYAFVDFSAWKYPTRPEVWVHLYETIAAETSTTEVKDAKNDRGDRSRVQELRIGFRCGVLKAGWLPLYLFCVGIAAFLIPFLDGFEWIRGFLGLSGIAALITFLGKATNLGRSFAQRYLALPDHSSQLGMQAVIGKDLNDLLRVWISPKKRDGEPINLFWGMRGFWWYWGLPIIFMFAFAFSFLPEPTEEVGIKPPGETVVYKSVSEFPVGKPLIPDAVESAASNSRIVEISHTLQIDPVAKETPKSFFERMGSDWPKPLWSIDRITLIVFWLILVGFGCVISFAPKRKEKLLLVIDDLDRCRPDQMLSVIESLRLFLDDPGMRSRLQIAMLVDNRLLGHALLRRAKEDGIFVNFDEVDDDSDAEVNELSKLGANYIQEQREKLFLAELALSKLDHNDLDDIAFSYVRNNPGSVQTDENVEGKKNIVELGEEINEGREGSRETRSTGDANQSHRNAGGNQNDSVPEEIVEENAMMGGDDFEDEPLRNSDGGNGEKSRSQKTDERFHDDEIEPLRAAIRNMEPFEPTPRQIRTFLARYQLARLILENQGVDPEIQELIRGVACEMGLGTTEPDEQETKIRQVARLVVCPPAIYKERAEF